MLLLRWDALPMELLPKEMEMAAEEPNRQY